MTKKAEDTGVVNPLEVPSENGVQAKAKGLKTVTVLLVSKKPGLLLDPMWDEILLGLQSGVTTVASEKGRAPDEIAEGKLFKTPDGKFGIKLEYFMAALREAGRKVKNGKYQIATAIGTSMYDFLEFEEEPDTIIPFKKHSEWVTTIKRGVGNTGVAVAIVRPRFKEWELELTFTVDENEGNLDIARKLFVQAGKVGVGGYRPERGGNFGRFAIGGWKVHK